MGASDITVGVRLTADGKDLVGAVRASRQEIEQLGVASARAGDEADKGFSKTRAGVQSISQQLKQAKEAVLGYIGAYAGFSSARWLADQADAYSALQSRLKLVTEGTSGYAAAYQQLFGISARNRQGIEGTVELYGRLVKSTESLNLSQQRQLGLTETIGQALVVGGGSAESMNAAIMQLGQGLGAGALRGDELNSVLEQSPRLAQAIADGMGVSVGSLRGLAEQGKLTTETVVKALEGQADRLQAEFQAIAPTIGGAWTVLENAVTKYIGEADQGAGASKMLAGGIMSLANNFGALADATLTLGYVVGVVLVAQAAKAIQAKTVLMASTVSSMVATQRAAAVEAAAALQSAQAQAARTAATLADAQAQRVLMAQMAIYGPARAAIERQVTAATIANTAATNALAVAQARVAQTAAVAGIASRAAAASAAAFGGALALVGGPIGALVLAVGGFFYLWQTKQMEVKLAFLALINQMQIGWEHVKYAGSLAWEGVKALALGAMNAIREKFGGFLELLGKGARAVGLDGIAGKLDEISSSMQGGASASEIYAEAQARLRAERDKNISGIRSLNDAVADEIIKEDQAAKKQTEVSGVYTRSANAAAQADKKLEDAYTSLKNQLGGDIAKLQFEIEYLDKYGEAAASATAAELEFELVRGKFKDLSADKKAELRKLAQEKDLYAERKKQAKEFADFEKKLNEDSAKQEGEYWAQRYNTVVESTRALNEESRGLGLELILDDKDRAYAQLEIEKEKWLRIIALAKDGSKERQDIEEAYYKWLQSKAAAIEIGDFKKTVEQIDKTFHDGFVRMLEGGKSAWKSFSQSLANTFKSIVADEMYKAFLKKPITIFANVVANGIGGMFGGGGAGGKSAIGTAGNIASIYNMGSALLLPGGATFGAGLYSAGGALGSASLMGYGAGIEAASLGSVGVGATVIGAEGAAGSAAFAAGASGASSVIGAALASIPGWGWAAMAALAILGSGAFRKPGNEWGGVFVDPDATGDLDMRNRIVSTHGKDALFKTDSGLELGGTWKRTDGEQTRAALTAMKGIDATLYGLTNADMTGKLSANFYGYDKKHGGFRAGDKTGLGSMDEVLAQFTRDWVDAAGTVQQINKDLVAGVTGTSEEVLKKTIAIVSMTQADMDKLFGEAITTDKIKAVAKAGESAGDAFARLAPIFASTGNLAKIMGTDVATMFKAAGLDGTKSRETMVKEAGGADALNAQLTDYQNLYFSDAEKLKIATDSVSAEFAKAGKEMPKTKDEYRKMMEDMAKSGALATDEGAKLYAQLLKLAPAFAAVADATEAAKNAAIQDAQNAVDAARANLQEAYNREAGALQSVIDKMGGFAKAIKQFRDGLLLSDLSPLSPFAKYDEAKRRFDDVSTRAALGDTSAMEELQSVSQAYLEASRAYNASNTQYVADFNRVQQALSRTEGVATRQADIAQQQLAALNKQVEGLLNIDTSVKSVALAIQDLAKAMGKLEEVKKPPVVTEKDVNGVWTSSGGAKYVKATDTWTDKNGNTYKGAEVTKFVNDMGAANNGKAVYDAAIAGGVSANTLDTWMGWKPGTSNQWAKDNGLAAFADGGYHTGGLRLVGERGWEIEATGPARIWNQEQLGRALSGSSDNKETVAELKTQNAQLKTLIAALLELRQDVQAGNEDNNAQLQEVKRKLQDVDGRLSTIRKAA